MSMGLRLDLKQSQGLVLTPQLQQAIKLLQLSNIELEKSVQREVAENPFLAVAGPQEVDATASAPEREREIGGAPTMQASTREADDGWHDGEAQVASDRRLRLDRARRRTSGEAYDENYAERLTLLPTLAEHLRDQIAIDHVDRRVRDIALHLVDWLEEDGYLREEDAALAATLGVGEAEIAAAREAIMACDPIGVGARDLAACLAAQLKSRNRLDPAMKSLLEHLHLVARADFTALQRICGVDLEDVREMIAEIKDLDPRPGHGFQPSEPVEIVPDVLVMKTSSGKWRVEINSATLPRVMVDRTYYGDLTARELKREDREFMSERYQAANWLVKALDQRARTMLRVSRAIFARQLDFLDHGSQQLRPLVLRDIADATGLHESTVSRATADKFAMTPRGTFPLRYFFSTAIAAADGEEAHSAEAIRQQIRTLIDGEEASRIFSDDQIVNFLRDKGVMIARRTVAKYRESLGIPSSVQRRRSKALSLSP